MARYFTSVKLISALVPDEVSIALNRRGFAKAAKGALVSNPVGGATSKVVAKATEEASSSMWVPDPVTGYYRPHNQAVRVDAAELRKRLLRKTFTNS